MHFIEFYNFKDNGIDILSNIDSILRIKDS